MSHFIDVFFKKWSLYILEVTLLFVMLLPIHYYYGTALGYYIIVAALATALFQSLLKWKGSLYIAMAAMPLVAYVGLISGYPLFVAILVSLIFFWRNTILYMKKPANEGQLLLITLLFGVPYYLLFDEPAIVWFVLGQLILIAVVKVLSISFLTYQRGEQRRKYLTTSFLFLVVCSGLSLVAVSIYPYVFRLVQAASLFIISIIGWLLSPLFYLVDLIEVNMDDAPTDQSAVEFEQQEDNFPFDEGWAGGTEYYIIIAWVIGIVVLALFLAFIIRNVKQRNKVENVSYKMESLEEPSPKRKGTRSSRHDDRSLNNIRKSFFSLQKTLARYGYYREASETAEDWLANLPLTATNKNSVLATYQSVRYGYQKPTKEQIKAYNHAVKELKKEAKENNKNKAG